MVSWAAEVAAGGGVGVVGVFEDLGTVDEDGVDAGGVLVGLGKRRMVGERGRLPYKLSLSSELFLAFLECFGAFLPVLQLLGEGLAFELFSNTLGALPLHLNAIKRLLLHRITHRPGDSRTCPLMDIKATTRAAS